MCPNATINQLFGENVFFCGLNGVGVDEDIAFDDPMDVEDDAGVVREFATCLTAGNVDKKTHGLVILWQMLNA